jgi:ABC-type Fe3+-hydroxamate transport system substrate-binding protein
MGTNQTLLERAASYIYKLDEVIHVTSGAVRPPLEITSSHMILLMKEASGELVIGGHCYTLQRNQVFLLPPAASIQLNTYEGQPIDYYRISFHVRQIVDDSCLAQAELDVLDGQLQTSRFHYLLDKVQDIQNGLQSVNRWDGIKAGIQFQELMLVLLMDTVSAHMADVNQGIAHTLDYMKHNYHANITREKLAEIAGLSPDYYSRAFKKKIGKSPMEYLTEIRINHAKQSLLLTQESHRIIAQNVGFSDEFYFSRRFKAVTGFSPSFYVNRIKCTDKIASMKHLLTGHLLTLGIEPYAAVVNNVYPITTELRNTIAIGESKLDMEKLMSAKPELIIMRETRNVDGALLEKLVRQIAPTVTLSYYDDWRVHLRTIANVIGRTSEASDWLERYESKAEEVRKQLGRLREERTVLIVGIGEGRMCVYGNRNLGAVLYGDLRLAAPCGVEHIAHYKEITLDELHQFDADHILLTNYKHDGSQRMNQVLRGELHRLASDERWQTLKAVKQQAVYSMVEHQHLYTCYTSYSHELLLNQIQSLMTT